MRKLLFVLLALLSFVTSGCGSARYNSTRISDLRGCAWPAVRPLQGSHHFIDHRDMKAKFQIEGIDGTPLYLLECYINAYDYAHGQRNFDYGGDFECRLTSLYPEEWHKQYRTLLTDNKHAIRDWDSRGVFMIEEMSGNCADYPEYGRLRHFKLRGMNLTLEVKDFQVELGSRERNAPWYRDRIKELAFEISVTPDPKATSEIAEPTGLARPPAVNDCTWSWPTVQPIKKSYHFVDHEGAELQILGTDGTPLYLMECHLCPTDDLYDQDPSFNYSGVFDCRLTSLYSDDEYSTLLTEEKIQTRDATRARFSPSEFFVKCADYPDWGRVRHFRLRGMNLRLEVKDLKFEPDGTIELDFEVTVTSDPTAITEIAEPTRYAYPLGPYDHSHNCERVLIRDVDVRR